VNHVHFHVIPKNDIEGLVMKWNAPKPDMDKIGAFGKELAEKIAKMN
jgi:diadenosine tetraphosphate (Ap4A) HIT family hydrolase